MSDTDFDVLIIGAGPCGLMLANELGQRGIRTMLADREETVATAPQANATQARSMEHYRRHGFAHEIRMLGLPQDHPTDVSYFTTFNGYELGRFAMPKSGGIDTYVRENAHIWNAAEMPHRIAQSLVEQTMLKNALKHPSITIAFNEELQSFKDHGDRVTATLANTKTGNEREVSAQYLFAADGPQSLTRKSLGIRYDGGDPSKRDFMGGEMLSIYIDAPTFYDEIKIPRAWMYWTFNPRRRGLLASVDGVRTFTFASQMRPGESKDSMTPDDAGRMFIEAVGKEIPFKVTGFDSWISGRALVAQKFQKGRVLMGGDAVHLFTPTGGMGYNTAVEDAVNIGWKLAAVIRGEALPRLLESYETERKPVAVRNTGFAARFADSVGLYAPSPAIEDDTPAGELARARAGAYLAEHGRNEFTIPGFSLGARYDGSALIIDDGTRSPPDQPSVYAPSAKPGGRAPHFWMDDDSSLFDNFGFEWTLLLIDARSKAAKAFEAAAAKRGVSLKVLDLTANDFARDFYEAPAALVRPDQIVAWRGDLVRESEASDVLGTALGDKVSAAAGRETDSSRLVRQDSR